MHDAAVLHTSACLVQFCIGCMQLHSVRVVAQAFALALCSSFPFDCLLHRHPGRAIQRLPVEYVDVTLVTAWHFVNMFWQCNTMLHAGLQAQPCVRMVSRNPPNPKSIIVTRLYPNHGCSGQG
jgi:hypothetical protein